MRKYLLIFGIFILAAVVVSATGCGSSSSSVANSKGAKPTPGGKTIISGAAGNGLSVSLSNADGTVHRGQLDFTMTFFDGTGKVADLSNATLVFKIGAFGAVPEQSVSTNFIPTGVPGTFHGKADLPRLGEWEAQIDYDGAAGKGSFTLPIVVK